MPAWIHVWDASPAEIMGNGNGNGNGNGAGDYYDFSLLDRGPTLNTPFTLPEI